MMLPCCLDVTRRMVSAVLFYLLGAWILLTEVSGQSQWIAKPADRSVSLGSNTSFTCKPNIVNDTQIVWTKETTVLFVNGMRFSGVTSRYTLSDPYTLFITNVLPLDNGQFGCNAVDSGTVSAQLTVLLPPGQPSISSSLIGDIFREGQVVDFNCTTTGGNPHPTINWMKNGVDLLNSQTTQASTVGGLSWSIVTVTMDHSDHRANYTCFVHNIVNENNPLSVSRILAVQYSPIITFNPYGTYNVRQGQMANLTCLVDANPIVSTVMWLKNGASLDGTGLSRVFSSVMREDAGNYTCIASNVINSNNPTRNTTYINVVYPPIVSLPASLTVLQGKNVSMVCKVDANPSPYQIQWYLPDGTHAPSATEVLTILQVTVKDAGNYSCRANSQLRVSGGSQQGEIVYGESFMYLYVQYPPGVASLSNVTNINIGERLQIHCTATPAGYPTASFRWRKNGTDQSQINGTFIIPSTTLLDNGVYSCTPYNSVGEGVPDTVTINVNEPPSLLVGLPEEQTLLINNENPLTLTCKGQGRPQPTIEWFKDNEMENLLSSNMSLYYSISNASTTKNTYSFEVTSTLYFKGPGRERTLGSEQTKLLIQDLGTYTCRVRSPVHTSAPNSTMQLWVQFKPVLLQNSEKMAVLNSEEVNLVCEAQAYPNPNFTWYRRSSQRIAPSMKYNLQQEIVNKMPSAYRSVLTIMEVQVDDYGMYSCEVSNFLGKVTQLINITTKSSPEAPNALQTMDRTWESVFLQWVPGFDGGYPQTFWVQIRQSGSPSLKIEQVQPESSTSYNITGLKPSTRYEFSVFGRNQLGDGQSSSIILSQTRDLEIPTLGDSSVIFNTETNKLVITNLPGSQYCLKIEAAQADGRWKVLKPCTILFNGESVDLVEKNIVAVNVSVCLLNRMEVCSAPMTALIFSPPNSPALTERDVIIIACVCAVIIITLLIVLICFICRRRQASAKQFENEDGAHQPTTNGGMPGKKPQQQGYDNTGMVLEDLPDSRGHGPSTGNSSLPLSAQNVHAKNTNSSVNGRHVGLPSSDRPPNYWDLSPQHHSNRNDTSYDSDRERQIIENEMNSNNEPMYGRADGYHGRADLQQNMHSGMRSPTKDKYIDLEERKDPSNMSHESGYSTGDPSKPKKVIYEVVV